MPVYQEQNKSKWAKDGRSWYFRHYYTNIYGKREQKESRKFFTKKEAKQAEKDFENELKQLNSNMLFSKLKELYLIEYEKKNKKGTFEDTRDRINKHISPIFDDLKVIKIALCHFELLKGNISHLDIKTQNSIITYLKSILQFGVDNYDLDIPVLPKIKTIPKGVTPPRKYNIWNIDEFNQFIKVVDDDLYRTLFILLYYTGLRIGELQGLQWNDLNGKIISISKSYNKHERQNTTPKTSNSYRDIDLPNVVIEELNKLYEIQKTCYGFNTNYYIFGDVQPVSRTTLSRQKDKYIKLASVKRITIHEFRHSHVSLLRKMGYTSKQIAHRIGDTETTVIETYSHLFDEDKFTISDGLNRFFEENKR